MRSQKYVLLWVLVGLLSFLGSSPLQAHHGGGGTASLTLNQSVLDRLYPPRSTVYFNFEYNDLDSGGGYTMLYQVRGEYAFLNRFSIGGRIPVWTAENDFASNNTRLGDVALLFKALAWESRTLRMSLLTGLDTTFPTGNDQVSLGAGAITLNPYVTYVKDFDPLDVFVNVLGSFEVDSTVNPTLAFEAGLLIQALRGKVPLSFFLSFQGVTFLASDTFNNGDVKAFIVPGILVEIGDHWEWGLLGRISVVDTLSFQPNVAFNDFVTGLYTDINTSILTNFGYKF